MTAKQPFTDPAIRLLIVDDHAMFRLGVKGAARLEDDIEVVAEAVDAASAIDAYRQHNPDVVLMDLRMPDGGGVTATAAIVEHDKQARVIVLSTYDGYEEIYRALEAGASSYLSKDISPQEVMEAVRRVHSGERFLPEEINERLSQREGKESPTPRERETLTLIVRGCSNKEISKTLGIAENTVKVHMRNLFTKLGALDRTQAAIYAVREGIVPLEEAFRDKREEE